MTRRIVISVAMLGVVGLSAPSESQADAPKPAFKPCQVTIVGSSETLTCMVVWQPFESPRSPSGTGDVLAIRFSGPKSHAAIMMAFQAVPQVGFQMPPTVGKAFCNLRREGDKWLAEPPRSSTPGQGKMTIALTTVTPDRWAATRPSRSTER